MIGSSEIVQTTRTTVNRRRDRTPPQTRNWTQMIGRRRRIPSIWHKRKEEEDRIHREEDQRRDDWITTWNLSKEFSKMKNENFANNWNKNDPSSSNNNNNNNNKKMKRKESSMNHPLCWLYCQSPLWWRWSSSLLPSIVPINQRSVNPMTLIMILTLWSNGQVLIDPQWRWSHLIGKWIFGIAQPHIKRGVYNLKEEWEVTIKLLKCNLNADGNL